MALISSAKPIAGAATTVPGVVDDDESAPVPPDRAEHLRVEESPRTQGAARAGPAVQVDDRKAGRRSDGLPVQGVPVGDIQMTGVVRFDGWVKAGHGASRAGRQC
jgi:hypothetical protein